MHAVVRWSGEDVSDTGFLAECVEHSSCQAFGLASGLGRSDEENRCRAHGGGGCPGGTNAERNSVLCLEQSQLGPAGGQISRADGAQWAPLCVAANGADTGRWTSGIVPVQR